jgi:hypothetical protein
MKKTQEAKKTKAPKYKDTVFRALFSSNPAYLRELYEAIEGITVSPDTEIKLNTLEDVLYRNNLNDLSFLLGKKLVVLVEHQSTINHNISPSDWRRGEGLKVRCRARRLAAPPA